MMKISSNTKRIAGYTQENVSNYGLFEATNRCQLSEQSKPSQFAGKRARAKGTLYEKTTILTVDSIRSSAVASI